jgi:hypothetical protein
MIVVVATYSPPDRKALPHLGGARKIEAVIGILGGLDPDIVLVNTAHNDQVRAPLREDRVTIGAAQADRQAPESVRGRRAGRPHHGPADAVAGLDLQRLRDGMPDGAGLRAARC